MRTHEQVFLSTTASLVLGGTNVSSLYRQIVKLSLKIFFLILQHKSDERYPRCIACLSPLPTKRARFVPKKKTKKLAS